MTLDAGRIRTWLDVTEKSPEWLAVQLDVSLSTVTKILGGKAPKKAEVLLSLARVMGCRIEDLVAPVAVAKRTA